jgi:para-nitrobenzyl esterase
VYALTATPLAKNLFHKAIAQSVWITSTNMTHLTEHNGLSESAESRGQRAIGNKLAELGAIGGGDMLESMRALSAEDVLSLQLEVSLIEDGWVYPKSAPEIFAEGSHNIVPLLAGINDGEGLLFVRGDRVPDSIADQRRIREAELGEFSGNLLDIYVAASDADVLAVEVDYNTDSWFARPTRELVRSMARTPAATYMYVFTRNLQDPAQRSPHAMELRYVFNELPDNASEIDQKISELMNNYWVQFAATGHPNRSGLPQWPSYDLETQQHQLIGADVEQGAFLLQDKLDELDRYVEDRYQSAP